MMVRKTFRFALAALLLLCPMPAIHAQTQVSHQAVITWVAQTDATASTTYNVYRATAACPASGTDSLTFTKLNATPITSLTYTDGNLAVGNYCYYVTQVLNGVEASPSPTGGGPVRPNTITTIQIVIS